MRECKGATVQQSSQQPAIQQQSSPAPPQLPPGSDGIRCRAPERRPTRHHARRGASRCVAVIVAVGVNTDGRHEVLGLKVGASEAEPFWTEFLRSLNRRGLRGVKQVISDSHEGLKASAAKVLKAT